MDLALVFILTQALLGLQLFEPLWRVFLTEEETDSVTQLSAKTETDSSTISCGLRAAYRFSFPPGGGSTRAALGRKGDFGERESCEGDAAGPSL